MTINGINPNTGGVNFLVWSCTFKPYVIMLSDRLVRTSRNGLSHKMEPLSLPSTSRGVPNARVMMNMLAIQ